MLERQDDSENAVCLVLTTFASLNEARQIGTQLIEQQLAACVNLTPGAESIYLWQGELCREAETVAVFKTVSAKLNDFEEKLQEIHPYDEPECLVLPVEAGSQGYLSWVRKMTE